MGQNFGNWDLGMRCRFMVEKADHDELNETPLAKPARGLHPKV